MLMWEGGERDDGNAAMVSIVRFPYLPHPPHVDESCMGVGSIC